MKDLPEKIKNKYDMFNVQFHVNKLIKENLKIKFKTKPVKKQEILKFIFSVVLALIILLSYFHKIKFPYDKWLIILCVILYFIFGTFFQYL